MEIIKVSGKPIYDTSFERSWLGNHRFLKITRIRHTHVKLYHFKPQTFKHVVIIRVSDKPTYDTSFERSWLGDHRFGISPWYDIHKWNYTISDLKLCYTWMLFFYARRCRVSHERSESKRRSAKSWAII